MKKDSLMSFSLSTGIKAISLLALLVAGNALLQSFFFRIDLTADKRYSIAQPTKDLLKNLQKEIDITIYLDGELNQGFRQLKKATKDLMEEFSIYGGSHINFTFSAPGNQRKSADKNKLLKEIESLGITPVNVVEEGQNGTLIQKPVYPWAAVSISGKTYPVKLLINMPGKSGTENLNLSIENLEFLFTDAIRILTTNEPRKIAFIEGHGELDEDDVYDVTSALSYYYQIDRGQLGNDPSILDPYEALIIANPQAPFSEGEKFVLDQYIMHGGKVLWFLDGVGISIDSLSANPMTMGLSNDVNLDDVLFRYGIRVNAVLLQDLQCALIPINTAAPGQKAEFHPAPWFYSPILGTANNHPITANLSPVKGNFVSSVDTVGTLNNVKRTFLLRTSPETNILQAPAPVALNIAMSNLDSRFFNKGAQPVAVLEEGIFPSAFKNRSVPPGIQFPQSKILKESAPTRMIVVADGDILRNETEGTGASKQIFPLNYDRYTKQELYGNKEFVLNAINYLTDGEGWMTLRNRNFKLYLLNKVESNENRLKWQLINVLLPLLMLLIGGAVAVLLRKRKYAQKQSF